MKVRCIRKCTIPVGDRHRLVGVGQTFEVDAPKNAPWLKHFEILGVQEKAAPVKKKLVIDEEPDSAIEVEYPVHTGGGHYELSDGSRVRGKEAAEAAEAALVFA